ncbi:hypothetical protein [Erinnyis ello granulovirus]|uniref:Uncharacterized protein n=1 Tax=Erinnyis ello granulovirus TaxID=307444 RepID=A0A097DAK1_9BBAC|nr:hypothetical protein [Erinnyis ello granulovirus]AIS92025.1 hypothetical protein [Erinnyis ello granulovirus]ARX71364.1 hypothetical protein EREL_025 [Erinnyis ello granulovirus]ARX71494.1 hypothetical protein EREL_025 [Erinnyis ello granulovirus]ARX71624.1 hypothetical protein EREL_025 [Erinnyis ello granulovirus]ARX71754.1 hypothetical protein EREL_025 [Erinnyis ello granulovirus]
MGHKPCRIKTKLYRINNKVVNIWSPDYTCRYDVKNKITPTVFYRARTPPTLIYKRVTNSRSLVCIEPSHHDYLHCKPQRVVHAHHEDGLRLSAV